MRHFSYLLALLVAGVLFTSMAANAQSTRPRIIREGDKMVVLGNYETYQWFKEGVKIDGATLSSFEPKDDKDANYSVETTFLSEVYQFTPSGIDATLKTQSPYEVYPNPSNGICSIRSLAPGNYTVKLINSQGQIIWKKAISSNGNSTSLDLTNNPNGAYSLTIEGENFKHSQSILLDK